MLYYTINKFWNCSVDLLNLCFGVRPVPTWGCTCCWLPISFCRLDGWTTDFGKAKNVVRKDLIPIVNDFDQWKCLAMIPSTWRLRFGRTSRIRIESESCARWSEERPPSQGKVSNLFSFSGGQVCGWTIADRVYIEEQDGGLKLCTYI